MRGLVTGSTSGIGRATALALGRLGADVFVHGRDAEAGREVVAELSGLGVDASFVAADFASVESVRDLAATVRDRSDGLDLLVNNAGGLFREGRLTDLGVEYTFHVNHLSPYLLTTELLPTLADDARIVTTSSGAHRGVDIEFEKIRSIDSYSSFRAYQRSKLANVLFSTALARRLDRADCSIISNAFHPGAIPGSGFARFLPGPLPRLFAALGRLPMTTTVEEGAATAVYLAASPQVEGVSGRYFTNCEPETPSKAARDTTTQRRLWAESATLLGIDEPLAESDGDA